MTAQLAESPPAALLAPPKGRHGPADATRFRFDGAGWPFYESVDREAGVFVTYHKGTLELATVSLLHGATSRVIYLLVKVLAEETDLPLRSAGSATVRLRERDVGLQGDEAFYFGANVARLQPLIDAGSVIEIGRDPPPDLAVEVEVTQRLGSRLDIYREMGVAEVWRYDGALTILVLGDGGYEPAERSPRFPMLSPQEIAGFVADGVRSDETTNTKRFRRRVVEALGQ